MKKTFILCILDGCGIAPTSETNAWANAEKPNIDGLITGYSVTAVRASGQAVGLPAGQMGNSEVGHLNIGAGRRVLQPQEQINEDIKSGAFYKNPKLLNVINHVKKNQSDLHIMGLVSNGGVHSHINHLLALLELANRNNIERVYLHLFTDGRDTGITTGKGFVEQVQRAIDTLNLGEISTISGRYYAMDRDNNYERTKLAYDAIIKGEGDHYDSADQLFDASYSQDITDEFIKPSIIKRHTLSDNDGLIVFNYRPDRLRQMCTAITNPSVVPIDTITLNNVQAVSMMPITDTVRADHAYDTPDLQDILGVHIQQVGLKQLRVAETEKYAHVTYFFDGGKEIELKNSKRILVPSPKVATYDQQPCMSAPQITDNILKELEKDYLDIIIVNFANGDMVGHTGNYDATVKAVECMDGCIGKIWNKVKEIGGTMLITADHGNCEQMANPDGSICTTHTTNPVPVIITEKGLKLRTDGELCDIAPTVLELMKLPTPIEMTGTSLIER